MGYAIIIPELDFSGKDTHTITPKDLIEVQSLEISGADTIDVDSNQAQYTCIFNPANSTFKGLEWSLVSGLEYAKINPKTGQVTAKYVSSKVDPSNPNKTLPQPVTIKVTSSKYPISATKDIQVVCNVIDGAITVTTSNRLPQNGQSFTLTGFMDGHGTTPIIAWHKADDLEGVNYSLHDNEDGTCTVTVLNGDLKKIKIEAYNSVVSTTKTEFEIWVNNFVIIDASKSANDAALMRVIAQQPWSDANYNTDPTQYMYAGEAAEVKNVTNQFQGNTEISVLNFTDWGITNNLGISESSGAFTSVYFAGCTSLTEFYFPRTQTKIGGYSAWWSAFRGCTNLKKIVIYDKIESINDSMFIPLANCSVLLYVNSVPTYKKINNPNNTVIYYVPNELLSNFEATTGWSDIYSAGRIKPMSQYNP